MKRIIVTIVAALLASTAAYSWNLSPCSANALAKRADFERHVRAAAKGSPDWVPYPFPRNEEEAAVDFRYQALELYANDKNIPKGWGPFIDQLKANQLTFLVQRVEDWTGSRCEAPMSDDFLFLLRVFNAQKQEVGRADIARSGVFRSLEVAPSDMTRAQIDAQLAANGVPDTQAVLEQNKALGAHDGQLIASWGTLTCRELTPCVAFRAGGNVYIQNGGNLYKFAENARHVSWQAQLRSPEQKNEMTRSIGAEKRLMSLGDDDYAVVEVVH